MSIKINYNLKFCFHYRYCFIEKMNNDMDEFIDNQHKKSYPNFKTFKVNLIKLMIYNETDTRTNVVNVICDKIEPPEIMYL